MKKAIERYVEIPGGVEVNISDKEISVKSNGNELKKKFDLQNVEVSKEENKVKISTKKGTRRESRMIGTISAHITNMITGVKENFIYKLEICNVHFPMNVKVEGNKVIIKSFLGETVDRIAEILPNVKVEVKGKDVEVSSYDKEAAGQTAANIEYATKLRNKDRRVFQDGIFITSKGGREL